MDVHFCSLTLKPQTMATLKPHQPLHHQNIKDQRQKRIICKLRDALLTRIAASSEPSKPIINSEGLKSNIDRRLRELIPTVHTPTHPPYASMIQRAIEELDEEGGLSEVGISEFIKREYEDLPVAHEGFLRHHLRKLCESGVVVNLEGGRYNLVVEEGDDGGVVDRESTSERWPGREDRGEIERMEEKMKGEEWQSEVMRRLDVQKQEHFEVIENKCEAQGKQMEVNEGQLEMASMELDVEGSSNKEAILGDIEVYENEVIQGNHHREEQQSGEVYKQNEPQAQEIEVIENHFQPQAGKVSEIGQGVQGQDIEVRTKILELCCHGDENLRTQGDVPLADRLQQSPLQGQEKRRPGRPRKPRKGIESTSRALLLLAPEIHHEEEPPRRRGMPRKAKKDMDASTRALMPCGGPQHHDEEQPPRLGDRPLKAKKNMDVSISALLPSDPEHHDEEQPPRRRGRRPKPKPDSETILAVVSCSDKQQQQQPQYRGRGRPPKPKQNSETSLAVVSCSDKQPQQQPQYRGRGRPPKPKPNSETSLAVVSCSDKQQKQPQYRGRGRHPKPKLDAENVKNPPQTPQIEQLQQKRRGRGRPSKLQ